MTKLSGHEATVLAFIARFPHSVVAEQKAELLRGDARQIADALLKRGDLSGKASNTAAADAIEQWASARA